MGGRAGRPAWSQDADDHVALLLPAMNAAIAILGGQVDDNDAKAMADVAKIIERRWPKTHPCEPPTAKQIMKFLHPNHK